MTNISCLIIPVQRDNSTQRLTKLTYLLDFTNEVTARKENSKYEITVSLLSHFYLSTLAFSLSYQRIFSQNSITRFIYQYIELHTIIAHQHQPTAPLGHYSNYSS